MMTAHKKKICNSMRLNNKFPLAVIMLLFFIGHAGRSIFR